MRDEIGEYLKNPTLGAGHVLYWASQKDERKSMRVLQHMLAKGMLKNLTLYEFDMLLSNFKKVDKVYMKRVVEQLTFFGPHFVPSLRKIKAGSCWANQELLQKLLEQTNPRLWDLIDALRGAKWARVECMYRALFRLKPDRVALGQLLTSQHSRHQLLKWAPLSIRTPIKIL